MQGYYSYDALTHEECKYEISTLFIAFQKQNYEIERKRNFREKKAKRDIFLFLQGVSLSLAFAKEVVLPYSTKKLYFHHF